MNYTKKTGEFAVWLAKEKNGLLKKTRDNRYYLTGKVEGVGYIHIFLPFLSALDVNEIKIPRESITRYTEKPVLTGIVVKDKSSVF